MSITPGSPSKTATAINAIGFGLSLLPFFVQNVETLFGKKSGQSKKDAVTQLVNASIVGVAGGFGLAGSPELAQTINQFRPLVSMTIDQVAAQLFPPTPPEPTPIAAAAVPVSTPDAVLSNAG